MYHLAQSACWGTSYGAFLLTAAPSLPSPPLLKTAVAHFKLIVIIMISIISVSIIIIINYQHHDENLHYFQVSVCCSDDEKAEEKVLTKKTSN